MALAAGLLSPLATVVLIAVTLLGALPVYRRVAVESPHGEGSIAMLERLLTYWKGKLLVLALLGFAATDFLITMTLSAADATAHLVENLHVPAALQGHDFAITLGLIGLLGAVFLRGFTEAIGVAVDLVAVYLTLNLIVIAVAMGHVAAAPHLVTEWTAALTQGHGSVSAMVAISVLVFPKLALGPSGFETGVAVMTHIEGEPDEPEERPLGRIRGARRLHRDPLVRGRIRYGRPPQPDPALPPAVRHGATVGSGRAAPRAGADRGGVLGHLALRRRRQRPGRRIRHRGARPDHLGSRRGHHRRLRLHDDRQHIERPDGVKIAACFITGIFAVSFTSRVSRPSSSGTPT